MKFKTIRESDNRLLGRREYLIGVDDVDKTPKREDLLKQISAKMGFDDKKVIIDKINTTFGMSEVKVYVKVYDNVEELEKIESKKNKIRRNKLFGVEVPKVVKKKSAEKKKGKK